MIRHILQSFTRRMPELQAWGKGPDMPNEHLRGVFGLFSPYINLLKDNPLSFAYYMGIITLT